LTPKNHSAKIVDSTFYDNLNTKSFLINFSANCLTFFNSFGLGCSQYQSIYITARSSPYFNLIFISFVLNVCYKEFVNKVKIK